MSTEHRTENPHTDQRSAPDRAGVRRWTPDSEGRMWLDERDISFEAVRRDSYVLASDYDLLDKECRKRYDEVARDALALKHERDRLLSVAQAARAATATIRSMMGAPNEALVDGKAFAALEAALKEAGA